jgi:hypothetical protein
MLTKAVVGSRAILPEISVPGVEMINYKYRGYEVMFVSS